ncbi:hypothetical protein GLOTRDRAFT_136127 [Gloeophyllum trabeum ATCC 11539]|uniref:Vacuolar membrane protein n=1 Tax=Gloeophyllum trabeum (strain ATCC 11539 / FP-39264 / Madison 617) TaxID=670483 RepID=S7RWD0_GLOTA|nr:uncharacterized protein GLOTRDRAFT_136127 [Gloeophyllum trabeum ATCC 11539]EPQ59190.1 hypothetical protein GLOTRDRAFT_136127 [Gloeophyllum trabeum ATCC 11539]
MHVARALIPTLSSDIDEPPGDSPFEDLPVDQGSCRLLGPTALVVQGVMGVLVILSLIYKRHREKPKRPWRIWLFDVSKQVLGQLFVHGVNILISDVGSHRVSGNACVYYFLNILIDTTLGVAIIYLILYLSTNLLTVKLNLKGFESGQYGNPPSINYWARQAVVYVLAITTMKLLVIALFALFPGIFQIGAWLLTWLGPTDAVQVIFVMGIFPILMNIIQFWLIDSIVKASASSVNLPPDPARPSADADREPLFRASEEDDDDHHHARFDIENQRHSSSRSRSRDHAKSETLDPGDTDELKPSASGSATPATGETLVDAYAMHAYPPSLVSNSTSSSRPTSASPPPSTKRKYKRSPPPPLLPRSPLQPAINSPLPSTAQLQARSVKDKENDVRRREWEAWDEPDDWAERVGEEDWTGSRIGARKGVVDEIWASTSPVVHAR